MSHKKAFLWAGGIVAAVIFFAIAADVIEASAEPSGSLTDFLSRIAIHFGGLFLAVSGFFAGWLLDAAIFFLLFFFIARKLAAFAKAKDAVMTEAAQKLGLIYYPTRQIPSDILLPYKTYIAEDLIPFMFFAGTYRDIPTRVCQLTDGNAQFNKSRSNSSIFDCAVFQTKKSYAAVNLALRHTLFLSAIKPTIQTESEAFNEKFTVYTDDPEGALQILQPDVMERLIAADFSSYGAADARKMIIFRDDTIGIVIEEMNAAKELLQSQDSDQLAENMRKFLDYTVQFLAIFEDRDNA